MIKNGSLFNLHIEFIFIIQDQTLLSATLPLLQWRGRERAESNPFYQTKFIFNWKGKRKTFCPSLPSSNVLTLVFRFSFSSFVCAVRLKSRSSAFKEFQSNLPRLIWIHCWADSRDSRQKGGESEVNWPETSRESECSQHKDAASRKQALKVIQNSLHSPSQTNVRVKIILNYFILLTYSLYKTLEKVRFFPALSVIGSVRVPYHLRHEMVIRTISESNVPHHIVRLPYENEEEVR